MWTKNYLRTLSSLQNQVLNNLFNLENHRIVMMNQLSLLNQVLMKPAGLRLSFLTIKLY